MDWFGWNTTSEIILTTTQESVWWSGPSMEWIYESPRWCLNLLMEDFWKPVSTFFSESFPFFWKEHNESKALTTRWQINCCALFKGQVTKVWVDGLTFTAPYKGMMCKDTPPPHTHIWWLVSPLESPCVGNRGILCHDVGVGLPWFRTLPWLYYCGTLPVYILKGTPISFHLICFVTITTNICRGPFSPSWSRAHNQQCTAFQIQRWCDQTPPQNGPSWMWEAWR